MSLTAAIVDAVTQTRGLAALRSLGASTNALCTCFLGRKCVLCDAPAVARPDVYQSVLAAAIASTPAGMAADAVSTELWCSCGHRARNSVAMRLHHVQRSSGLHCLMPEHRHRGPAVHGS